MASIPAIPLSGAAGSTSLLTSSTLSKWAAALSIASGPQNILPPTLMACRWPPDLLPLSSPTKRKASRSMQLYQYIIV